MSPLSAEQRLKLAHIRITQQRLAIVDALFGEQHQHVSADALFETLRAQGVKVSLATVYNTLNQLKDSGQLRQVMINKAKSYFDTNTHRHHHFYDEQSQKLTDISASRVQVLLDGQSLHSKQHGGGAMDVDVIIRLRKQAS